MQIQDQCKQIAKQLIEKAKLKKGDVVVIGCSTSEVVGETIGTNSSLEIAKQIFDGLYYTFKKNQIFTAFQCCEHLNRAIVVENVFGDKYERVNVVPVQKAGGSLATIAYNEIENAIVVENIKADAGIDIGGTLIGMHLKNVAVPVRLSINSIGKAHIICARVRPKFVGGSRAVYDETLL